MKIILIGFMGTGKTTVAPIVAEKLGLEAIEMDDLITREAGGKSIAEIFEAGGETAFRQLEMSVSQGLRGSDNVVISTGGGVVTNKTAMDSLTGGATVVELSASFETVLKRINSAIPRPLFQNQAQAKALYELREPLYSNNASIHIATDDKSIEEVAREIINKVPKP